MPERADLLCGVKYLNGFFLQDMHDHIEQVRNDFRAQNEALQEENRKLREENEALKKTRKFYQA